MPIIELAVQQWREGERRLHEAPADQRMTLERVVDRLVVELRHRLGGSFRTDELAGLYEEGTSWCADIAISVAPGAPWAWDQSVTADAAFGRYWRGASDYAGGRRIDSDA